MNGSSTLSPPAEMAGEFDDLQGAAHGLRSMLVDEIGYGLIVCDRHGAVRFANRPARHELDSARLLRLAGDALRCVGSGGTGFEAALKQAALKGRRQLVPLQQGSERLMVSVIPLQMDDSAEALVLVVLGRRGPCSALGVEMLANVHGLTLTERRVLAALLGEVSPREIAKAHGVAMSTVRTQISSIRLKLGVRSIEGLMIRAAELPPVTVALRHGHWADSPAHMARHVLI
jgi:DNA-binding CsgD family transcriptional regulator